MVNVTKTVEKYINEHPSIKDCLKKDLINYSKLSRLIGLELNLEQFDALLIACRRYKDKLSGEVIEDKIIDVLKKSKVEVKNKVLVVVLEKKAYSDKLIMLEKEIKRKNEMFHLIEGTNSITIVTSEEFLSLVKKSFKKNIIKVNSGLAEVVIKSPEELEETVGVVAYLYSLFSEHGVNVVEQMSCWTDTLFVVKEDDVGKIIGLLRF